MLDDFIQYYHRKHSFFTVQIRGLSSSVNYLFMSWYRYSASSNTWKTR